jgi:ABC-type nitrate/sulfonate/bicarbonate transport system substrate-binding protein
LELRTVSRTSPLNAALKDGRVGPRGFRLAFEEVEPVTKAFRRMCRELAYDVTEMAATTYLVAKEHGKPFTALPVFLTRGFHHGAVVARAPGDPKALEGARVGVNRGYTVTTGVWARGILASEYGVDLDRVTWVRSDDEHVTEYEPPPNVEDLRDGEQLTDFGAVVGDVQDERFVPLLEDADAAANRYLERHRNWPVNHLVVVRDELLEAHPDLAPALFEAFERAKDLYVAGGRLEPLHARAAEVMGADPLPYGVEPNRAVLEELVDHAVAQRILARRPAIDSLFA